MSIVICKDEEGYPAESCMMYNLMQDVEKQKAYKEAKNAKRNTKRTSKRSNTKKD